MDPPLEERRYKRIGVQLERAVRLIILNQRAEAQKPRPVGPLALRVREPERRHVLRLELVLPALRDAQPRPRERLGVDLAVPIDEGLRRGRREELQELPREPASP